MVLPLEIQQDGSLSITSILKMHPNKTYVEKLQQYEWRATMHMTGLGLDKAIEQLDYFESDRLYRLRQKYCASNKDLFSRLHRPIDKIFNAKGGSTNYLINNQSKKEAFVRKLADIKDGLSLRNWIESRWLPAYHFSPMGLIMVEVEDDEAYPVYKPVSDVFDMPMPTGRTFEYIIFKTDRKIDEAAGSDTANMKQYQSNLDMNVLSANKGYYRVVDDAKDYLIKWDGGVATIVEDETFPNHFGKVPAVTASGLWDIAQQYYKSPDDDIFDLADQFLRERGNLLMFEMHHAFPVNWMYSGKCPTCNGVGRMSAQTCTSCNGTGRSSKKDASKLILIDPPKTKDDPIVTKVSGSDEIAVESWQEMKDTKDSHYGEMHFTLWGTHQVEAADGEAETATGRFIDVQPVNDRLGKTFSDAAEWMEEWLTDMLGEFYVEDAYEGCEINLGRRYLVESPDVIWEKLQAAITTGKMTYSSLKNLYMQWVDSEYSGDEMTRLRLVTEFKLSYAPFLSLGDMKAAGLNPQQEFYYRQWLETLPEMWWTKNNLETLVKQRDEYVKKQMAANPLIVEPAQAAA